MQIYGDKSGIMYLNGCEERGVKGVKDFSNSMTNIEYDKNSFPPLHWSKYSLRASVYSIFYNIFIKSKKNVFFNVNYISRQNYASKFILWKFSGGNEKDWRRVRNKNIYKIHRNKIFVSFYVLVPMVAGMQEQVEKTHQ